MTVSAQTPINRHTANGVTTVFPFTFKVLQASDLEVSVGGVVQSSGFTVSGVGANTGEVTFTLPPATGAIVVLRRVMAIQRTTDYQDQGAMPAGTVDDDHDATVMMVQQVAAVQASALQYPVLEGISGILPAAADRAGKLLGFNSLGLPTVSAPVSGSAAELALDLASTASGKGASMVGFNWAAIPAAIDKVDWGIYTAATGLNVLRYIPPSEWAAILGGTSTYDATAAIQAAIDSGATDVQLPEGKLEFTQIIHRPGLMRFTGRGQATGGSGTYLKRRPGATGPAYVWDGATRIVGAEVGGFRMDCNSEAGETYGLDLSGFSYCTFKNIWVRLARLDGVYADGSITPTNKQFSNNTVINVRSNNNLRDGFRFDGSVLANTANTYVGCEAAVNAGIGFNEIVGYANQTVGCTFQGNTGRDFYTTGSRNKHDFYAEGNAKPVELGAASFGNQISVRTSYPLWNTFTDNGQQNTISVRGEVQPEKHIFDNPAFLNWVGATPTNIALSGTPAVASFTDASALAGAGLQLNVGANFQGLIFTLDESAAQLQGKWVTLLIDVETSGVVDPLQTRTYTRDGATLNGTTGEFAVEALKITAANQFVTLAYDVKFAASVAGVPTVIWYAAYSGIAAGGNIIKIRSARIVLGQTRTASPYLGVEIPHSAATATISSAANGINTHRKFAGRIAYETSTGKMRFAIGAAATSAWRAFDGSGDLTPT